MPFPVYSERLYLINQASENDFQVPEGFVWVVKMVYTYWSSPGAWAVTFTDANTNAVTYFQVNDVTAPSGYSIYDNELQLVLPENVVTHISAGGAPSVGIYGYALTAP